MLLHPPRELFRCRTRLTAHRYIVHAASTCEMRRSGHDATVTWTPMGSSWRCGSAWLSHQLAHRPVQPLERERIHATAHELAQHADRRSVVPLLLRDRIEPDAGRVGADDALHP